MKRFLSILIAVLLVSGLIGCAKEEPIQASKEEAQEKEQMQEEVKEEPSSKTIEFSLVDEKREVTIPNDPKRIVVIGFDLLDIVDALGYGDRVVGTVDPKGALFPEYIKGYEEVTSVGSLRGDDLETIAGLKPDLILAGARTFKAYESLNEIAPTIWYSIPGMGNSFEETLYKNITSVANIFNDEDKAKSIIGELKGSFEEIRSFTGELEDSSALFLMVTGKTLALYSDDKESRYGFVFNEFGFTSPASLEEIENAAATHGNSISFEFISAKNPNYLIVIDRGVTTGETDIKASDTLDNELVAATKAHQKNQIIYLDGTAWYLGTGGVQATKIMIENIMSEISQ